MSFSETPDQNSVERFYKETYIYIYIQTHGWVSYSGSGSPFSGGGSQNLGGGEKVKKE